MTCILGIDDDPDVRTVLQRILAGAGYDVLEAPSGRTGMYYYQSTPVDLVVTDLLMPEQEGLETIRTLRARHPSIKVIAISGGGQIGQQDYLRVARALGAHRTLRKPVTRQELLTAVRELLAGP